MRNLAFPTALALSLVITTACNKGNDGELPALACAQGFIINAAGDGCIQQNIVEVFGVVTDGASGRPIAGVTVTVSVNDDSVETDANGSFAARGPATGGDTIKMTFSHPSYGFATLTRTVPAGGTRVDGSIALRLAPRTLLVQGTVYAGDSVAEGAVVILRDAGAAADAYETLTDAEGKFSFPDVDAGNYNVVIPPFDEDGDTVTDYAYQSVALGNIHLTPLNNINITNIIISLTRSARQLEYINLVPTPAARTTAGTVTGSRFVNPGANIILHFGAEMDPATVDVVLREYEAASHSLPARYSAPLDITQTWSHGDTILTIDPADDLVADANPTSQYALRINSAIWSDGVVFLSQTNTGNFIEYIFDVSANAIRLDSPTPSLFLGGRLAPPQDPGSISCDSHVCWIFDSVGYYLGGWTNPYDLNAVDSAMFNDQRGFELTWPHVDGANSYRVYMRRSSDALANADLAQWAQVPASISSGIVDPNFNGQIYATIVGRDEFENFDVDGIGPLGGGATIEFAVTAVDFEGHESILDGTKTLAVTDTTPAALGWASIGTTAGEDNWGHSDIAQTVTLTFDEFLDTSVAPEISVTGGDVVAVESRQASWENSVDNTPYNTGDSVTVDFSFDIAGSCTRITCPAYAGAEGDNSNGSTKFCVREPALLDGASQLVISTTGGTVQTDPGVASVDVDTGIVTMNTNLVGFVNPATDFACRIDGPRVTTMTQAGSDTNVITVDNAYLYPVGASIGIIDTVNETGASGVITAIRGDSSQLVLNTTISSTIASGSIVVRFAVGSNGPRFMTSAITLREPVEGAASTTFQLTDSLINKPLLPGDICLVDADGDLVTARDRYFGSLASVHAFSDTTNDSTDNDDFRLTLDPPPAGFEAIPAGEQFYPGATSQGGSLLMCLGHTMAISNSADLVDTAGNTGMVPRTMHFSRCSGTPGCGNFGSGGFFFY